MRDYIIPLIEKDLDVYFIQGMRKGKIPFTNAFLVNNVLFDTGISSRRLKFLSSGASAGTLVSLRYVQT